MAPKRPTSGWPAVAALAAILGLGVGVTFYGLSVYLSALTDHGSHFSLATVSLATALFLVVNGVAGAGVAVLLQRLDARLVINGGLVVTAVGLLLVGRADAAWQLHASYALMGAGYAATSVIPVSHLVASWFTRRRTLAMTLVFVGLPVGGALLTPPIAWLVETRGIADATPWLAGLLLVLGVPLTLLLAPRPAEPAGPEDPAPPSADGVPFHEAVGSRWFVLVTLALSLGMLSQLGLLAHLYHAVESQLDASTAASAVSLTAASSLVGRLVASWGLSYVRLSTATVWLLSAQGLAVGLLAVADRLALVVVATVIFGATMGNLQAIQPLLLLERFGGRDFARILGRGNLLVTFGMAAGPAMVGLLHDWFGDYRAPLAITALPALVGAACMVWASRSRTAAPVAARVR